MSDEQEFTSRQKTILLLISIIAIIGCFSYLVYLIAGTNILYIADKTPVDNFTGDYTTEENLTTSHHGVLSKLDTTGEAEVGILIDLSGNYEYKGDIYN